MKLLELVEYAFEHGRNGDIFVKKAPACTLADLAAALKELLHAANEIRCIGTRHGEKLYETLVNREEMAKAEDLGDYYRIPADTRDLNYDKYFSNGDKKVQEVVEYTSHNTTRLDVEGTKKLLLTLDCVQDAMHRAGAFVKILVTGAQGFIGRNLLVRLKRDKRHEVLPFDVQNSDADLDDYLVKADCIIHLAGINRPLTPEEFMQGNFGLTSGLLNSWKSMGRRLRYLLLIHSG
jgi:FlaA1/EpsC-like NDP-sugar epimerase